MPNFLKNLCHRLAEVGCAKHMTRQMAEVTPLNHPLAIEDIFQNDIIFNNFSYQFGATTRSTLSIGYKRR